MGDAATSKDNLIRTAMRLFRRQGYALTGLQQIVAESGAPKGSLYHYFPAGKEALGEAAVTLAGGLVREMLEGHAAKHADPAAFLRKIKQDPAPGCRNRRNGASQLIAAIATERTKNIACHTTAVYTNHYGLIFFPLAFSFSGMDGMFGITGILTIFIEHHPIE